MPPPELLAARTTGVLAVVHQQLHEGYSSVGRVELAAEAIRRGRVLARLTPDGPEVRGLLALMLLQHAQRAARVDANGDLAVLEEQDRPL
ncbi:MAG: polymerase sigma-70 factor, subfamily [Frankiales bacterium]|nr:polymerase sigma-70 factor, subfamily [Frankiales bacterium]